MRKLLNVLYVTTPNAYVTPRGAKRCGSSRAARESSSPDSHFGGHRLLQLYGCKPFTYGSLSESGVALSFLTESGRFLARVTGPVTGNVLLRRQQFRLADDEHACTTIVSNLISAKISNCRSVLRRAIRDHGQVVNRPRLNQAISDLSDVFVWSKGAEVSTSSAASKAGPPMYTLERLTSSFSKDEKSEFAFF